MFIDSAMRPKRRLIFGSAIGSLMDENSQVQWFHSRWTDRLLTMMNWQTVDAVVLHIVYTSMCSSRVWLCFAYHDSQPQKCMRRLSFTEERDCFVCSSSRCTHPAHLSNRHALLLHVNCFCCEVEDHPMHVTVICRLWSSLICALVVCLLQND